MRGAATDLDKFLCQFDDESPKDDTTVFYRPSFGRGGPPQFGEFDAIVATSQSIYPIEAKWSESPEAKKNGKITLEGKQDDRHKIFKWYFDRYAKCQPKHKPKPRDYFEKHCAPDFSKMFPNGKFAPSGSKLAHNVKFVLDQLLCSSRATTTTDVLLYLHPQSCPTTSSVCPNSFRLVTIPFVPVSNKSLFFDLK